MGDSEHAVKAAAGRGLYEHPKVAAETHRIFDDDTKRSVADLRRELNELKSRAVTANLPWPAAA